MLIRCGAGVSERSDQAWKVYNRPAEEMLP